jgi:hypothetical protein
MTLRLLRNVITGYRKIFTLIRMVVQRIQMLRLLAVEAVLQQLVVEASMLQHTLCKLGLMKHVLGLRVIMSRLWRAGVLIRLVRDNCLTPERRVECMCNAVKYFRIAASSATSPKKR